MDTPSPFALASMLLTAPGWARVGLTASKPDLREQAALELATTIVAGLEQPPMIVPEEQMPLPL